MMPAMKLSSFPNVTVGARLSRSGDAIAQPGDLEGLVTPVEPATRPKVSVQISDVVP